MGRDRITKKGNSCDKLYTTSTFDWKHYRQSSKIITTEAVPHIPMC
jgi:hypothetical protein